MSTPVFSSTMFAVEKSPTEQPARVNGTHGAVGGEEVEQVRHLLEIGRDVGVVPGEVDVVEDETDHVLHAVAEMAGRDRRHGVRAGRIGAGRRRRYTDAGEQDRRPGHRGY